MSWKTAKVFICVALASWATWRWRAALALRHAERRLIALCGSNGIRLEQKSLALSAGSLAAQRIIASPAKRPTSDKEVEMPEVIEIECPKCQAIYEPDPERTLIAVYSDKDYNHLRTYCPICEHGLVLFFDNPNFLALGYTTVSLEEPQDDVREVYDRIMSSEPDDQPTSEFEAIELTPRQEAEIAALGSFLEATPDSVDLVDLLFSSPPPKDERPRLWG